MIEVTYVCDGCGAKSLHAPLTASFTLSHGEALTSDAPRVTVSYSMADIPSAHACSRACLAVALRRVAEKIEGSERG